MTELVVIPLDQCLHEFGSDKTRTLLSSFTCTRNPDIESFVRNKAIEFSKQGLAKTQLIFSRKPNGTPRLAGIIALSTKIVKVREKTDVSRTYFKRLRKYGNLTDDGLLEISSPLIAQFAKNDAIAENDEVDGASMLEIAVDSIRTVQDIVGGRTAYLECADEPSLVAFYETNGFSRIATRAPNGLVRMMRYLGTRAA